MPTLDDTALLARIAHGDQEAFHALYEAYYPRLWRYVWYQVTGDVGRTEEMVQEIVLAIWRAAPRYRGEARVATWIFRIAHHLVSNAQRDQRRRGGQAESLDDDEREHDLAEPSFEDGAVNRMTLIAAIELLSPKHQAIVDLFFIQGFSLEEVAQILSVPLGTVKSRIQATRRALRRALETSPPGEGARS